MRSQVSICRKVLDNLQLGGGGCRTFAQGFNACLPEEKKKKKKCFAQLQKFFCPNCREGGTATAETSAPSFASYSYAYKLIKNFGAPTRHSLTVGYVSTEQSPLATGSKLSLKHGITIRQQAYFHCLKLVQETAWQHFRIQRMVMGEAVMQGIF